MVYVVSSWPAIFLSPPQTNLPTRQDGRLMSSSLYKDITSLLPTSPSESILDGIIEETEKQQARPKTRDVPEPEDERDYLNRSRLRYKQSFLEAKLREMEARQSWKKPWWGVKDLDEAFGHVAPSRNTSELCPYCGDPRCQYSGRNK